MQSSLTINSQYAVSHGGHMMVQMMFILPYWSTKSTKILPSHTGEIQRYFKKTQKNINLQPFAKISHMTFSIGVGKYNFYVCSFKKTKRNNLKEHNQIKLRGFIQFRVNRVSCVLLPLLYLTFHTFYSIVPTNLCKLVV